MVGGVDDGEWRNELVGDAVAVELFDPGEGFPVGAAFGEGGDHRVEGLARLFPAEVAVHGVIAAADAGKDADVVLLKFSLEVFEKAEAAGGKGVAAIHEGMDEDAGELTLGGQAEKRGEV